MSMLRTLMMSLAITAMLVELAMAANYTVGGSNGGWDTSTNLQSWASSQSFSVGDNLIFAYTPNHDVVEVTKADYDSCQTSNSLQSYTGGATVIPLASPGKRYFICGTSGHCSQGMKVEIDTLATSAPPPATPSTPPPASSPPPKTETPPPAPAPTMTPPSKSPVGSPPEIETPTPAHSPTSAPKMSPPSKTIVGSPASSPTIPSTGSPANSPSPSVSSPPPPSSASTVNVLAGFTVGFGFAMTMLLTL
uniref:Putative uclacyanin-3-like isoform X1 n=1 Tax=Davidia involucrata TaxID=16924 RepID=A0A5B7BQX9_DAVIN